MGVQIRRGLEALSRRVLAVLGRGRRARRVRRRRAREHRAGSSDREDREPSQGSALDHLDGPQPGLRRLLPRLVGQRDRRPQADEPRARGQRQSHYAVVEPGVSYFDLYRHILERGLKVWIDPADPGWGSPLGNALERGGGRTPMKDHWNAVCGLEVVLPSGELLRTGMGAMTNNEVWHQYKYGFGPVVDGLFSQSNFGIVTRIGLWLMPAPEGYRDGRVDVPRHDDLVPFMETYAQLTNSDILRGTMLLESP